MIREFFWMHLQLKNSTSSSCHYYNINDHVINTCTRYKHNPRCEHLIQRLMKTVTASFNIVASHAVTVHVYPHSSSYTPCIRSCITPCMKQSGPRNKISQKPALIFPSNDGAVLLSKNKPKMLSDQPKILQKQCYRIEKNLIEFSTD